MGMEFRAGRDHTAARMIEIPEEFRNIPEAARLRRADAELFAAVERVRQAVELANIDWRDLICAAESK